MSERISTLLDAEEKARETVEAAEREARRIRAGIPAEQAAIEKEYQEELARYREKGDSEVEKELAELQARLARTTDAGKQELSSRAGSLAPRAIALLREAIEGERG